MRADTPKRTAGAPKSGNPVGFKDRLFYFFESKKNRYLVYGLLVLFALAIPFGANNYVLEVLSNAWFYCILCLGLNIVIGYAGLLDLRWR